MSFESVMLSNHLILCHPLLLLPSIFCSIRVFPSESALPIRWPKYGSFSFSNGPSNESSGLISFKIDWFDLLYSPRYSQKSYPVPQFKSTYSSVLSLLYGPALPSIHDIGKTIALTRRTVVNKVISLLFNTLSRSVIALLPRSKHL